MYVIKHKLILMGAQTTKYCDFDTIRYSNLCHKTDFKIFNGAKRISSIGLDFDDNFRIIVIMVADFGSACG